MPKTVRTDLQPRLEAAREAVKGAREVLAAELRKRDALIVSAIDEGMAQRSVARFSGVSNTRVVAVLADSDPEALIPRL